MASTSNALKLLGLENANDPALLWQSYMDRLAVLQAELVRATVESRQQDLQTQLAELVGAYQLLRSVRRGPPAPGEALGGMARPRWPIPGSSANALPRAVDESTADAGVKN